MTRKRKAKAKQTRNQTWLAAKLGVTQGRISQLLARDGWRWRRCNWTDSEVEEIRSWHIGLREENPATANQTEVGADGEIDIGDITDLNTLLKLVKKPEQRIKLAGVIERAAKVKVDRELLLGGYLKKEDVEAGQVQRVQAVRQELSNLRLLAIRMENKTVQQMERELEDWARGVCNKFERGIAA